MMAKTHMAFGAGCWAAFVWAFPDQAATPFLQAQGLAAAVLGSLLPDIDHPKSKFGSKVPFISIPLSMIFGHRGITHSLLAIVGLAFAWWYFLSGAPDTFLLKALVIGYLSHLLGDFFTNSGIPLLYPWRKRIVSPVTFSTGSFTEQLLLAGGLYLAAQSLFPQLAVGA